MTAFWGPHFPDAAHNGPCFWGPHFPDCAPNPTIVQPVGAGYAAALAIALDDGMRLKLSFGSPVIKHYDSTEQRIANKTLPYISIQGNAYLAGSQLLSARTTLVKFAAGGNAFLLGLPHEALTLVANANGTSVNVGSTSLIDWGVPGQRALVVRPDMSASIVVTIQSVTSSTVVTYPAVGAIGNVGGFIMPAVPVYLDAQGGFQRYPTKDTVERWQLNARAIMFGFENGANVQAFVSLAQWTGSILVPITLVCNSPGSSPNGIQLNVVNTGGNGILSVDSTGRLYTWHFTSGTTTLGQFLDAVAASGAFSVSASGLSRSSVFTTLNDNGIVATFAGGADKNWGTMGTGATVNTYGGYAVWDRGVALAGETNDDSIATKTELLDFGGVPLQIGTAITPDWGRRVSLDRTSQAQWQWLKGFLYAVRGRQKAWWLPTYRADLKALQLTPGFLKIDSSFGSYLSWSKIRPSMRLVDAAGVVRYVTVVFPGAVDNGDGTMSLNITCSDTAYNTGGGGSTLGSFQMLSFLELCRFESDDFESVWTGPRFVFQANARVVPA